MHPSKRADETTMPALRLSSSSLKIILLGLVAAVAYGIVHDQVTARICVEYFTVGHPRIIDSDSPTLLGLVWGIVATWWVGLPLGTLLALAARAGPWPQLEARDLRTSVLVLLVVMGTCAAVAGFAGYEFAVAQQIGFPSVWMNGVTPDKRAAFIADWWAHNASYDVGFLGGVVVCVITWWRRRRRARTVAGLR
jgi:hypothetical protein